MDFLSSWAGMGVMFLLLLALVGVFLYQRNKRDED